MVVVVVKPMLGVFGTRRHETASPEPLNSMMIFPRVSLKHVTNSRTMPTGVHSFIYPSLLSVSVY